MYLVIGFKDFFYLLTAKTIAYITKSTALFSHSSLASWITKNI